MCIQYAGCRLLVTGLSTKYSCLLLYWVSVPHSLCSFLRADYFDERYTLSTYLTLLIPVLEEQRERLSKWGWRRLRRPRRVTLGTLKHWKYWEHLSASHRSFLGPFPSWRQLTDSNADVLRLLILLMDFPPLISVGWEGRRIFRLFSSHPSFRAARRSKEKKKSSGSAVLREGLNQ